MCLDKKLVLVKNNVEGKNCKGLFKIKNHPIDFFKAVLTTVYSASGLMFEAIPELVLEHLECAWCLAL